MRIFDTVPLEDVARLFSGGTPSKANAALWIGEVPWLTPKDMGHWNGTTEETVSPAAIGAGTRLAPEGATFVAVRGMSLHNEIRIVHSTVPLTFNQDIKAVVATEGIESRFLYFVLAAAKPQLLDWVSAAGHGTGVLATDRLKSVPIPITSLAEQRAIAAVLGAIEDKIELNCRMRETMEAMAQAIFRDWFVDFGPVRRKMSGATDPVAIMGGLAPDPIRAAELATLFPMGFDASDLPVEWDEEPVIEQANWVNGAAYKKMHFVAPGEGLPVIKIAELKAGVTSTTGFTNTDLGNRYRIDDGELLFSWSGNPDTSIDTFIWTGGPAWLNQHIFAVRPNGSRTLGFLFAMLKYLNPTFAEIARDKQTTGLGHVTKEDLKRLRVVVPSKAIEAAFDEIMTPMFQKLQAALLENRTLAETRDYLLPRLMSGEVRVGDVALEIAA